MLSNSPYDMTTGLSLVCSQGSMTISQCTRSMKTAQIVREVITHFARHLATSSYIMATRKSVSAALSTSSRHVRVVIYSQHPLPATTRLPYSQSIRCFTEHISFGPADFLALAGEPPGRLSEPTVQTGALIKASVSYAIDQGHPELLNFMVKTERGQADEANVWICGWTRTPTEAAFLVEEMIRWDPLKPEEREMSTLAKTWR
jgi:hypothetical protein